MNYSYYSGYQQQYPSYQNMYTQQTIYQPLAFVNGIEGAKAFIVNPNQTIYLMDSDSNTMFIKTADPQGRYTLKSFNLIPTENAIQKTTPVDYVTKEDLIILKDEILKAFKGVEAHE